MTKVCWFTLTCLAWQAIVLPQVRAGRLRTDSEESVDSAAYAGLSTHPIPPNSFQPWYRLLVKQTQCMNPTFEPYQDALKDLDDAMVKKVKAMSMDKAKHENCRLCNIFFEGGRTGSIWNVKMVSCSIQSDDALQATPSKACLGSAGNPAKMSNGTGVKDRCLPCPNGCVGCAAPDWKAFGSSGVVFKCIMRAGDEEDIPKFPFSCGMADVRQKNANEVKSSCAFGKLTKHDFTSDLKPEDKPENAVQAAGFEATLSLKSVACSSWAQSQKLQLPSDGDKAGESVSRIADQIHRFARKENCRLCDVTMTSKKGELPWDLGENDIECAASQFGARACESSNGYVGWSKRRPCAPCPDECTSCEDDRRNPLKFHCAVMPTVTLETSPLAALTPLSWVSQPEKHKGGMASDTLKRIFQCQLENQKSSRNHTERNDERYLLATCVHPESYDDLYNKKATMTQKALEPKQQASGSLGSRRKFARPGGANRQGMSRRKRRW